MRAVVNQQVFRTWQSRYRLSLFSISVHIHTGTPFTDEYTSNYVVVYLARRKHNMMSETVVTMDGSSNNASNNPRQVPTVKTEPVQPNPLLGITLNVSYFRTIPGIIKLAQVGFGIICMSCASPALVSGSHWFLFVAVTAFIATLLWSFTYLLSLREALKLPINWIATELLNTGIFTFLYFIAIVVQLSVWTSLVGFAVSRNIAAGVFGIFNTLAYAAGSYFLYVEFRSSNTQ